MPEPESNGEWGGVSRDKGQRAKNWYWQRQRTDTREREWGERQLREKKGGVIRQIVEKNERGKRERRKQEGEKRG